MSIDLAPKNKGDVITFSMPHSEEQYTGIVLESYDRESFLMEFLTWRYAKRNGFESHLPGSCDLVDSALIDKYPSYKVLVGDNQFLLCTADGKEYKGI